MKKFIYTIIVSLALTGCTAFNAIPMEWKMAGLSAATDFIMDFFKGE